LKSQIPKPAASPRGGPAPAFQLVSFGCKVNQTEGETLTRFLRQMGFHQDQPGGGRPCRCPKTLAAAPSWR